MLHRNKREESNDLNNISTEVKNAKDFILQDNDTINWIIIMLD